MEIKVNFKQSFKQPTKTYRITVNFMEGDADGEQTKSVDFEDTPEEIDAMKKFILALECCNAAYPCGRGGYDEYNGLPEYDAFFSECVNPKDYKKLLDENKITENEEEFIQNWLMKTYNPLQICMDHPSDSNGISTSFDGYKIVYFDESGKFFPTEVKLAEDELNRIEEAKNFFK